MKADTFFDGLKKCQRIKKFPTHKIKKAIAKA